MTDTAQKIAEIREALEKATPGPWAVFVGEGWTEEYPRNTYVQAVWNEPDHRGSFGYRVARMAGVHGRTMADAHLIANVPEWLRFLLSEYERSEEFRSWAYENIDRLQTELNQVESMWFKVHQENKRLREQRDKLIEGLRWYADEDTHEIKRRPDGDYAPIVLDHGQRARDILEEIGVTVE